MQRIYKIPDNLEKINFNKSNIIGLERIDNSKLIKMGKLINKYTVTKKRYQNIFQKVMIDNTNKFNNKETYVEEFEFVNQEDEFIIFNYNKINLDEREFPSLHKYDFEETYDEEIYEITYKGKLYKLISNKFESYIEDCIEDCIED